jgi:hypothetical protein
MKKFYTLAVAVLSGLALHAQLSGTKNIPGDYATLDAAITILNTQGVGAGGVTFNLLAGNPQTAPAGGYVIGGTGSALLTTTSAANTVVLQGNGNTITAPSQTAGNLNDAIIKLVGADYITIKSFTLVEAAGNTTTAVATNNMTEWGIALLYASATDGAQNNTIQGNTITLNRTSLNTFGIYSNTRHSATAVTATAEATTASGSNSNNKLYGNTISNVNYAIVFVGCGTNLAAIDTGNDIGGTTAATGNIITDFGGGASTTAYTSVTTSNYAIFMNQQLNDNVSFNKITSGAGLAILTAQHGGIFKSYSVAPPTAGTVTLSTYNYNNITLANAPTTSQMTGMLSNGIISLPTATFIGSNNTFTGTISGAAATSAAFVGILNTSGPGRLYLDSNTIRGVTSTATTGSFVGIQQQTNPVSASISMVDNHIGDATLPAVTFSAATHSGAVTGLAVIATGGGATTALTITGNDFRGFVNTGNGSGGHSYIINAAGTLSQIISNNTFTNITAKTSGTVYFINNNHIGVANGTTTVSNNSIVTGFNKTIGGGTLYFYYHNNDAQNTTNETASGNNFSNVTVTGATIIAGWNTQSGLLASPYGPNKSITNNTFTNITGGTSAVTVMTVSYGNANGTNNNVSGNIITNITGGGAITGIASGVSTQNIFNNTISGLSNTGTGTAVGILINGGTTQRVYKNKIFDLQNSNAGGFVYGIQVSAGTTASVFNNIIGDLRAPIMNATNSLIGINLSGGTNHNVYFNTVYLNATSTGTNFGSAALSATTTATLDMRNNVLSNISVARGTGFTIAYRRSGTTLTSYANTSNNNLFYAGTPGAANLLFYDGTNSDQTLAQLQARMGVRDVSSVSENIVPFFISTTGGNAGFLHITAGSSTTLESGGANVSGITDDYDGDTRAGNPGYSGAGTAADIGADEFAGISTTPACVAPTSQGTALVFGTSTSTTQPATFTAAAGSPTGYLVVRSPAALVGAPVNGTVYSAGAPVGTNGTAVGATATATFTATGLTSNTIYHYTIFTYTSGACSGGPVYNVTSPLTDYDTTCAGLPTAVTATAITGNGFTLGWTPAASGAAAPVVFTIEVATDNAFANIVSTQNTSASTFTFTTLNGSTQYFYRVRANNSSCSSANTATGNLTTPCASPTLTGTTPATRCGTGTVTLGATSSAGVVNWYPNNTDLAPLFTGTSFTTPVLSNTTTYYAEPALNNATFTTGLVSDAAANLGAFTAYSMYFKTQNAAVINSVDIYPSAAGDLTVALFDALGNLKDLRVFTILASEVSTTVKKTLPVNFRIPAGSTSWEIYYEGVTINRGAGTYTYGTVNNGFAITGNSIDGDLITSGTRYYFYNWNVTTICSGPRTAVTATVTSAPTIAATAPAAVCAGQPQRFL